MKNKQQIELKISLLSVLKLLLLILVLWLFYLVKDIVFLFFVSIFIAALVNNGVKKLNKYIKNRTLNVVIIYFIILSLLATVLVILIPAVLKQVTDLHRLWPNYSDKFITLFPVSWQAYVSDFFKVDFLDWQNSFTDIVATIKTLFGGVFNSIIVLVLSFYMSLEEGALGRVLDFFVPKKHYPKVMNIVNKIEERLSLWFEAQLVLCFLMGILAYLGLLIFQVKYALVLALFAFIGEFIPYLGAIISTFFAVLFSFLNSPLVAIFVLIWFLIMHQLESNVFVPNIMKKAVGLNPVITILALLVGARLAGIVGAILSIPIATSVEVIIDEVFDT